MACGVRSFYYGREFLSIRPGIPGGIRLIAKDSLAAFILGAVFFLIAVASRYQLGMGDVKLFATMGFFLGLKAAVKAILYSFIAAFAVAVFLLLCKKKKPRESIPFAPCVFSGTLIYLLSVILS